MLQPCAPRCPCPRRLSCARCLPGSSLQASGVAVIGAKKAPNATVRKPSPTRSRAARRALEQEGTAAASHEALSRQAHRSARKAEAATSTRPACLRQPRWLSPAWLIALSPHVRTPRLCSRSLLLGGFLSGLLFVNVVTPCRGVVLRPAWSCLCGRLHLLRGYFPSVAWTPFRSARPNSTMAPTAIQCVAICSNTATQTSPRIPIKRPAR